MLCCALVLGALAACGGGENSDPAVAEPAATTTMTTMTTKSAEVPVTKSAASRVPVYRFFNTLTSAHFFTTSEAEKASVQATKPYMTYEGPAFYASSTAIAGLSPVYRLYNTATGVHFYTISEAEKNSIVTTQPQFTFEGIAYHASTLSGTGYTPLYRFFYTAKGFHFYSNSSAERDNIIATLPQYHYEGIGYYVLGSDWQTPAVPHTGITSAQCYQGSSNFTLGSCGTAGAINLNPQQDGHRTANNPMSYSQVPRVLALPYAITSCVRDNVTGLVWEGKTSGNGGLVFANYGVPSGGIDVADHVASVNGAALCGFTDWRLPTVEELQGIADYSRSGGVASVNPTWFPNTQAAPYWTATLYTLDSSKKWTVEFNSGNNQGNPPRDRNTAYAVRLVRGTQWVGQRYLISTVSMAGDAANNAVIDRKNGLTWRRCLQGQTWNGSTCTGTPTGFTAEAALAHAKAQTGWRLPNVKELGGLPDRGQLSAPAMDPVAFPGAPTSGLVWTSTPFVHNSGWTWFVQNLDGYAGAASGTNLGVRLVRIAP